MKKSSIIIIIVSALVAGALSSCIDDLKFGDKALDKPQGVELTLDTIFSRAELARRQLWSLYHYTPTPCRLHTSSDMNADWYEGLSDCIHSVLGWGDATSAWYSGNFNAAANDYQNRWHYGVKSRSFEGMRIGHIFLENIDKVPDMSDAEKARLKAEAKVIIAGKHWEMFRNYGGIPLCDKAFSADDEIYRERATIEEMYNYMIQLLDEAIAEPELPWILPSGDEREWWGRITKAAAIGQKMLVQLHAASPIFNDTEHYYQDEAKNATWDENVIPHIWWGGYKPELWQDLKATCELFLSENQKAGNPYGLVQPTSRDEAGYMSGFRDAYWGRGPVRGVNELVYVHLETFVQAQDSWWDRLFVPSSASWGNQAPTAEFMEMFPWADGAPFDTTGLYTYNVIPNPSGSADYAVPDWVKARNWRYIYDGRDPRLYETLWVQKRGLHFRDGEMIQIWPGGNAPSASIALEAFSHGIGNAKWVMDYSYLPRERAFSWPIFRMAAFHLIYAEALAETGSLALAAAEINKVRDRVGLGPIENFISAVRTDKDVMIKEILRERACELGYEDTRFMDMVRRKLKEDFTKDLHGLFTLRKDGKIARLGEGEAYPELFYDRKRINKQRPRVWWTSENRYDAEKDEWTVGWSDKWFLTCFPQNEINKKYGLIQNPGW